MLQLASRSALALAIKAIIATALIVGATAAAHAAPVLVIQDGVLFGARNLEVPGLGLYDVDFIDGRCIDIFDGCDEVSDFAFDNETDAFTAGQALLDLVFLDVSPTLLFDSDHHLIHGCEVEINVANRCNSKIPYGFSSEVTSPPHVLFVSVWNFNATDGRTDTLLRSVTENTANYSSVFPGGSVVLAKFSQVPEPVPEPATGSLLALGLLGLAGLRWRARRPSSAASG